MRSIFVLKTKQKVFKCMVLRYTFQRGVNHDLNQNYNNYPSTHSGKPNVRILYVQPAFCRKGGGGVKLPCQMGCGSSLVNMNHY